MKLRPGGTQAWSKRIGTLRDRARAERGRHLQGGASTAYAVGELGGADGSCDVLAAAFAR